MIVILVLSFAHIIFLNFGYFSLVMASSQQSEWMKGGSVPVARSEVAGSALNGKLYIIGGLDNSGQSTTSVEVYDPITDKWSTSAPLPQPLDHAAAASYDGRLYVVGGGLKIEVLSDRLFIYDAATDHWIEGANMPTARGALTANFINGTLYAMGGIDHLGASDYNQAYDPKTDTWTEKAPMPTAREHLTSAVVDNNLYVIGGRQADNDSPKANINKIEMYNPLNDSWTIMEQMPTKRSGIAATASPVDGNIYVFGGENITGGFINTEKYNPEINKWSAGEPMPAARYGLEAIALDNEIYVIGGRTDSGPHVIGVNEIFHIGTNSTSN